MHTHDRRLVRRAVAASALLIGALVVANCAGSASDDAATTSAPSSTSTASTGRPSFDVELVDYGFDAPDSVPAGYVDLNVTNTGEQQHETQLGRLHDGVTWDDVEATLQGDAPDTVIAQVDMVGGVGTVDPGGEASATVHLDEGNYGVFCFVVGWDGKSHLAHGMAKPLDVTAPTSASVDEPPESEGTITLRDMAIELPDGFDGTGTWKVVNEGPQVHQALILQYAEGATEADVDAYLTATSEPEDPALLAVGGAGAIAKGEEEWIHLDLPKGTYRLLCVIPDPSKGLLPHFMEGMQTTYEQT